MTALPKSYTLSAQPNNSCPLTYSAKPRWLVIDGWLERDGVQLLAGPPAVLEQFSDLLNLLDPPRRTIPQVLTALMEMARGNAWTVGEALRRMGVSA